MCQVSAYIQKENSEELFKENVTAMELLDTGVRMKTLFEGTMDLEEMDLKTIDFSAGKIILEKR